MSLSDPASSLRRRSLKAQATIPAAILPHLMLRAYPNNPSSFVILRRSRRIWPTKGRFFTSLRSVQNDRQGRIVLWIGSKMDRIQSGTYLRDFLVPASTDRATRKPIISISGSHHMLLGICGSPERHHSSSKLLAAQRSASTELL